MKPQDLSTGETATHSPRLLDTHALGMSAFAHRDRWRWQATNLAAAVDLARALTTELESDRDQRPSFVTSRALDGLLCAISGALDNLHDSIHAVVGDDDTQLPVIGQRTRDAGGAA